MNYKTCKDTPQNPRGRKYFSRLNRLHLYNFTITIPLKYLAIYILEQFLNHKANLLILPQKKKYLRIFNKNPPLRFNFQSISIHFIFKINIHIYTQFLIQFIYHLSIQFISPLSIKFSKVTKRKTNGLFRTIVTPSFNRVQLPMKNTYKQFFNSFDSVYYQGSVFALT